jgi:membrane protein
LYQTVQWVYISLQIGASSYNAIYGSFAALPLFLVWLQVMWMVVLFGCEIAFYVHNFESYRHNEKFSDISFSLKKTIALQVIHLIIKHFAYGEKALNAEQIAKKLVLPISVVHKTLDSLVNASLIAELNALENEEGVYQPSRDINCLTNTAVIAALEDAGRDNVPDMEGLEQFVKLGSSSEVVLLRDV